MIYKLISHSKDLRSIAYSWLGLHAHRFEIFLKQVDPGAPGFLGLPGPRGFRGCWMPNSWPTLWVSVLPWVRAKAPAGSRPWLAIAEVSFSWFFMSKFWSIRVSPRENEEVIHHSNLKPLDFMLELWTRHFFGGHIFWHDSRYQGVSPSFHIQKQTAAQRLQLQLGHQFLWEGIPLVASLELLQCPTRSHRAAKCGEL